MAQQTSGASGAPANGVDISVPAPSTAAASISWYDDTLTSDLWNTKDGSLAQSVHTLQRLVSSLSLAAVILVSRIAMSLKCLYAPLQSPTNSIVELTTFTHKSHSVLIVFTRVLYFWDASLFGYDASQCTYSLYAVLTLSYSTFFQFLTSYSNFWNWILQFSTFRMRVFYNHQLDLFIIQSFTAYSEFYAEIFCGTNILTNRTYYILEFYRGALL